MTPIGPPALIVTTVQRQIDGGVAHGYRNCAHTDNTISFQPVGVYICGVGRIIITNLRKHGGRSAYSKSCQAASHQALLRAEWRLKSRFKWRYVALGLHVFFRRTQNTLIRTCLRCGGPQEGFCVCIEITLRPVPR